MMETSSAVMPGSDRAWPAAATMRRREPGQASGVGEVVELTDLDVLHQLGEGLRSAGVDDSLLVLRGRPFGVAAHRQ